MLITAVGLGGCLPPGTSTAIEKGVAEARGGRGEAQVVRSLPAGRVLDRFRSVRVLPVERSPDAGPIPGTLPAVLGAELIRGLREAHVFLGGGGPTLILHVRLTTHWPAGGALQAVSAYSEILARVELREEGQPAAMGIDYVRGYSTAIKRKADEDLSQGLTAAILGVIQQHHSPLPPRTAPP